MANVCQSGDEIAVEMDCLIQRQQNGLINPTANEIQTQSIYNTSR